MFLEPHFKGQRKGWIEVICGSMFSGKTEELIRRTKRAEIAQLNIVTVKPSVDTRYHEEDVVSHNQNHIHSIPVQSSNAIFDQVDDTTDVLGIDEAQFFDNDLPEVCQELAHRGIRVIVAGLDMDFKGKPFGPIPHLLAVSEYITKVHAICHHCGNLATHSYRLTTNNDTVMLGEKQEYEARCRTCYNMGEIFDFKKKTSTTANQS